MLLVSGATRVVAEYPDIGVLVVPGARNRPEAALAGGRRWGGDNGAFSGFNARAFLRMLDVYAGAPNCLFVAAPDVVGNADETLRLFTQWAPVIEQRGFPVAFIGQDGLNLGDVPWDNCAAVFIGGSTEWKLGPVARDLAAYGNAKGKWVHMGRVNTKNRVCTARRWGCHSIDGQQWSKWSRRWIPEYSRWLSSCREGL